MINILISQILESVLNWLISVWWYWVPAGLGFLFRFGILKYKIYNPEMRVKAICRDIGIVFFLTAAWTGIDAGGYEDSVVIVLFILTMIYVFYGLAEQCEETGGTTESLLLIIKSILVTMLSFQSLGGTVFGATVTITLAILIYRFWVLKETKTDLFEIIFLCIESIVLSFYGAMVGIEGIGVFLFVFFEETAVFSFNCVVRHVVAVFFGEEGGIRRKDRFYG